MDPQDADDVSLSVDTLRILNEFLQEKSERERVEQENIETKAGKDVKFEEDWQLSQFWYSEDTKETLSNVIKKLVEQRPADYRIALLSCPSLYNTVKEIHDNVRIFEYDQRFAAYGDDFVYYDFNAADEEDYLKSLYSSFDIILADPPFLSEECITKMSKIIRNLQKPAAKIIFCSGEVVEPWLTQCLQLKKCKFRPQHERNLGNEFVSYANFELDELTYL